MMNIFITYVLEFEAFLAKSTTSVISGIPSLQKFGSKLVAKAMADLDTSVTFSQLGHAISKWPRRVVPRCTLTGTFL